MYFTTQNLDSINLVTVISVVKKIDKEYLSLNNTSTIKEKSMPNIQAKKNSSLVPNSTTELSNIRRLNREFFNFIFLPNLILCYTCSFTTIISTDENLCAAQ